MEKNFFIGEDYIHHKGYIYKKYQKIEVDPKLVIECCCNYFCCSYKNVVGKERYRHKGYVPARHMAMYILRKLACMSLGDIARVFNKKDHSTVHHAVKKVEREMEIYYDTKEAFNTILNNVKYESTEASYSG